MKVKAKVSFSGAFSMCKEQVAEVKDKKILSDLLRSGYVEEVKKRGAAKNESESDNSG